MELIKANLLFKGRKLPDYIASQQKKRSEGVPKSTEDLPSQDYTSITWALENDDECGDNLYDNNKTPPLSSKTPNSFSKKTSPDSSK